MQYIGADSKWDAEIFRLRGQIQSDPEGVYKSALLLKDAIAAEMECAGSAGAYVLVHMLLSRAQCQLCAPRLQLEWAEAAIAALDAGSSVLVHAAAYNTLGGAYLDCERHADAIAALEKSLRFNEQIGNERMEALVLTNLGGVLGSIGLHAPAIAILNQAIQLFNRLDPLDILNLSTAWNSLAYMHLLSTGLQIHRQRPILPSQHRTLAMARWYARKAIALAHRISDTFHESIALQTLVMIDAIQQRPQRSVRRIRSLNMRSDPANPSPPLRICQILHAIHCADHARAEQLINQAGSQHDDMTTCIDVLRLSVLLHRCRGSWQDAFTSLEQLNRMEQDLQTQLTRQRGLLLAEESRQRDRYLIAFLAHDLRAPLRAIHYLAEEQAADLHKAVRDATCRALRDIDNTLSSFRYHDSELAQPAEHLDLSLAVESAVDAMAPLAQRDGVRLTVGEMSWAPVFGRVDVIERVIRNLLDNALRVHGDEKHVSVDMIDLDGYWLLEVADRGAIQPGSERADHDSRYGFGLNFVRRAMIAHGGYFRLVRRSDGEGMRAQLSFPKERVSPSRLPVEEPPSMS
jgi:signal transduction histidine kinase